MWRGLASARVPAGSRSPRAWRRSWLLGFTSAVVSRIRAAEQRAATQASHEHPEAEGGAALVLADRSQVIQHQIEQAYPITRKSRVTYSGSGYTDGYTQGQQADLGAARIPGGGTRGLRRGSR
jgi:hypothetical protein